MAFTTPKRYGKTSQGKATWYSYYAGFSPAFVGAALASMGLSARARVLDPWNGSGTTTDIADENGLTGIGYDINPVMVMVAKARLLSSSVKPSHDVLAEGILETARTLSSPINTDEALEKWFQPSAAASIRSIEMAIQNLLISRDCYVPISSVADHSSISSLAAFFYVALFRVTRQLTKPFGTSNPTWLKIPERRHRLRCSSEKIAALFRENVADMAAAQWSNVTEVDGDCDRHQSRSVINVGNSTSLPEAAGSFAAALCSPPYCTRIDYAIATRVELAVLGYNDVRCLRESMIGTAVIGSTAPVISDSWGKTCNTFMGKLSRHHSKASASYYLKNHLQYFDSLYRSVAELSRVLRPSGQCVMVVQDSYYKDVHNNLPRIVVEMGNSVGWSLIGRSNFQSKRNMGRVNPRTRLYRTRSTATESVLRFRKEN